MRLEIKMTDSSKSKDIESVKGKVGEGMEFPGVSTSYISVREHMYDDPVEEIYDHQHG